MQSGFWDEKGIAKPSYSVKIPAGNSLLHEVEQKNIWFGYDQLVNIHLPKQVH